MASPSRYRLPGSVCCWQLDSLFRFDDSQILHIILDINSLFQVSVQSFFYFSSVHLPLDAPIRPGYQYLVYSSCLSPPLLIIICWSLWPNPPGSSRNLKESETSPVLAQSAILANLSSTTDPSGAVPEAKVPSICLFMNIFATVEIS